MRQKGIDTFETLINIKHVDKNHEHLHFWKAYSIPFRAGYAKTLAPHL